MWPNFVMQYVVGEGMGRVKDDFMACNLGDGVYQVWEMDINDKGEMVTCKSVCPLGNLGTWMELRGQGLGGRVWHSQVQRPWTFE